MPTRSHHLRLVACRRYRVRGTGPFARDTTTWNELRKVPAMRVYFDNMNFYDSSHAVYPEESDFTPDYFMVGLIEPGGPHQITVIKRDTDLLIRVENSQQVYFCKMSTPALPAVTERRVGLRHRYTRSARYRNFRISALQRTHVDPLMKKTSRFQKFWKHQNRKSFEPSLQDGKRLVTGSGPIDRTGNSHPQSSIPSRP